MESIIYKYKLDYPDTFLNLGDDFEVLDIQMQGHTPYMWVKLDIFPDRQIRNRRFRLFGTGRRFDSDIWNKYHGTFQDHNDEVWHVFQCRDGESIDIPGPSEIGEY